MMNRVEMNEEMMTQINGGFGIYKKVGNREGTDTTDVTIVDDSKENTESERITLDRFPFYLI